MCVRLDGESRAPEGSGPTYEQHGEKIPIDTGSKCVRILASPFDEFSERFEDPFPYVNRPFVSACITHLCNFFS